jgi:hypothetical protein
MSSGYISEQLRARVRSQAKNRCGYCLSPQKYILGKLEIEHTIPTSKGGTDDEENFWLACTLCNTFKASFCQLEPKPLEYRQRLIPIKRYDYPSHYQLAR